VGARAGLDDVEKILDPIIIMKMINMLRFLDSRDSSVGIATATCWTAGVRFLAAVRDFSLRHSVLSCGYLGLYPRG
jgi:hypothetical protein